MVSEHDQFQLWLVNMDDALDRLVQSLPISIRGHLDFSPESLDVLEAFLLERYPTIEDIKKQDQANAVDGFARYVGQVFRRHLGGRWGIELADKKNAFYGLPQLFGVAGQRTQICPLTLVTASTDRRTGKFIRAVFDNCQKRGEN